MTMADIPQSVAAQGLQWLVLMWSGEAGDAERAALRRWLGAHPDHERAWQRLQGLDSRLLDIAPAPAAHALAASARVRGGRRKALRTMGLLLAAGAAGGAAWRELPAYTAGYRCGTGQRKAIALDDGTRIVLNTDSAIDVEYGARERRVVLLRGEIHIETGHGPGAAGRPFLVQTSQGQVWALGTRYDVREDGGRVAVNVQEGAVEIRPRSGPALRLEAGQGTVFDARGADAIAPARDAAWVKGLLVADRMRLDDFLAEVARYRPGFVRCDPAVGGLIVSGVYPLADTDVILASLQTALPLRVSRMTRYWVNVGPA